MALHGPSHEKELSICQSPAVGLGTVALHGPKGSDTNFASMELRSADSLPCDTDAYLDADVDDG